MTPNCRVCGADLVIGVNVTQHGINTYNHICRNCNNEQSREYSLEYRHRTGRQKSMSENRDCPAFLGVYVAERVLSHVFKNVVQMPYGNPGYDFICGGGYKIDAKSSCRRRRPHRSDQWIFTINKNQIAEYFLCLAFDTRESMNPEKMWLIPAEKINNKSGAAISESTLLKWDEYELDMDDVVSCCNILRSQKV